VKISKNRNGKWVIDFNCRGHRINRIVGTDHRQAEEEAVRVKAEILAGRFIPLKEKGQHRDDASFAGHADEFLELHSKQNKRSWRRDEVSIGHLKSFFAGMDLGELNAQRIEQYKAKRKGDGVSEATVNRELACLKTMLSKAVDWDKLRENPAGKVKKFREAPARERILDAAEAQRLIEKAGPGLRPVLVLALNTGMRRGEILSLRWRDVDTVKGFILISDSKSGKSRKIPMNGAALEALAGLRHTGEFVFQNSSTDSHVLDVKTAFHGACRRAGIKGLRFHDLRHTAASRMVEAGIDLVTVSKILGHASIQMTMRYAHPTPENMRLAVHRLGEFFESGGVKVESRRIGLDVTDLKSYN
jgi:integrase